MSAKRTERLLTLVIMLLSSRRGYTKEELFDEIDLYREATSVAAREKLFDRDKAALREQGIPLESFSEDTLFDNDNTVQRYRINAEDYRLGGVTFQPEEYAVLNLAAGVWDQGSLDSAASRALRKLSSRSTDGGIELTPLIQPRITTDAPYWDVVWHALTSHAPIRFPYRAASTGREEVRTVHPWGMGARFGHWYVVGFDTTRKAERFFRLSRMTGEPVLLKGTFDVPASFDMNQTLSSLARREPDRTAVVAARPGSCQVLRVRKGTEVLQTGEEWDILRVPYAASSPMAATIAGLGTNARVEEPQDLAAEVQRLLQGAYDAAVVAPQGIEITEGTRPAPRRKSSSQDHLLRLLDLVPYLLAHPGAELGETARRFEVTESQLSKDLDLLFVSGPRHYPDALMDVNIEDGRIYLGNARDLAEPVKLSMDEACSLIVGLQALRELPGMRNNEAIVSAQTKLTAAAGDAARIGTSVATKLTEDDIDPTLEVLQSALQSHVRVEIDYFVPTRDEITHRVLEPIRIFLHQDTWYLEAWSVDSDGLRNFRLDRIQTATLTDQPASATVDERSPSRGREAALPYRSGEADQAVTLLLEPRARWIAAQYNADAVQELGDDRLAARLKVASSSWIPGLVAGLGGSAVVIAPEQLREETLRWLQAARSHQSLA
ncbi:WYL domain-containing protein [Arthrobacter sp. NamB2]|uniref:helix-turn-helix transcriptional regulator n=1 Tax=Arthrobacter sp. NamB2 TaxID=2576035 RepID=UPI0010C967A7|nr:WYL domain-containing protein [Arthrobacter sp. NamB2]TKV26820.1 WYL domain-containing protein [Arthrobacter sp. NamB2]